MTPARPKPPYLVRVVAPHFVAGLEIGLGERCVEAAPILRWCKGKNANELSRRFAAKGWTASVIDPRTHEVQL